MAKKPARKQAKKKAAPKKQAKKQVKKSPTTIGKKEELKWQAESDVHTLMRAEEIKGDQARMKRAQAMAKQQAKEATKVAKEIGK